MEQMSKATAHDAPETPHVIVERMELTGKGMGAAYDWRSDPPGEPVKREKKSPGAGGAEGNGSEGVNQSSTLIIAQNTGAVKPRTRREIILSALDVMGEAETAGFFITASLCGGVSVQFYDGRDVFDAILAARPGVGVTFQRMTGNISDTFRRSAVINGVEYYDFLSAGEAARYGIA